MTSPRMKPHHWLFSLILVIGLGWVGATWNHLVWAHSEFEGALWSDQPGASDVAPVDNDLYLSECGDCHFPYQPGLMPARGWEQVMDTLTDHFGDDAELDPTDHTELLAYLMTHAADVGNVPNGGNIAPRSVQIVRASAGAPVPMRISKLPYIEAAHTQVPTAWVDDNPEVGGAADCSSCHVQADKGYYNDSNVVIPGHGRWND